MFRQGSLRYGSIRLLGRVVAAFSMYVPCAVDSDDGMGRAGGVCAYDTPAQLSFGCVKG